MAKIPSRIFYVTQCGLLYFVQKVLCVCVGGGGGGGDAPPPPTPPVPTPMTLFITSVAERVSQKNRIFIIMGVASVFLSLAVLGVSTIAFLTAKNFRGTKINIEHYYL